MTLARLLPGLALPDLLHGLTAAALASLVRTLDALRAVSAIPARLGLDAAAGRAPDRAGERLLPLLDLGAPCLARHRFAGVPAVRTGGVARRLRGRRCGPDGGS
jgi:hypothetical protein